MYIHVCTLYILPFFTEIPSGQKRFLFILHSDSSAPATRNISDSCVSYDTKSINLRWQRYMCNGLYRACFGSHGKSPPSFRCRPEKTIIRRLFISNPMLGHPTIYMICTMDYIEHASGAMLNLHHHIDVDL